MLTFCLIFSIESQKLQHDYNIVPLELKDAYRGSKAFGNTLGAVGVGITLIEIGANGLNPSRSLDLVNGRGRFCTRCWLGHIGHLLC